MWDICQKKKKNEETSVEKVSKFCCVHTEYNALQGGKGTMWNKNNVKRKLSEN